jgi:hypothetical protein
MTLWWAAPWASMAAGCRLPPDVPESPPDVPGLLDDHARALANAIEGAIPGWVTGSVERVMANQSAIMTPEIRRAADAAASGAQATAGAAIRALLSQEIDDQHGTPLMILRQTVKFPTRVLQAAGMSPVRRDRFAERAFPDDLYDLTPASLADIDPALTDLGISWGAAKAFEHKRRHGRPAADR